MEILRAYTTDYDTPKVGESWQAFHLTREQNLLGYTREYLFNQTTHQYPLLLKRNSQGWIETVSAPGYGGKDILISFKNGPGERSQADYEGFVKVKERLADPEAIDSYFVILSPPGSKEEGFGDYSFAFVGQVTLDKLEMVAYKNYLSLDEQRRFANKFLPDEEALDEAATANDFLKSPVFLPKELGFYSHQDVITFLDKKIELDDNSRLFEKLRPLREKVLQAFWLGDQALVAQTFSDHAQFALKLMDRNAPIQGSCGVAELFLPPEGIGQLTPIWLRGEGKWFCLRCPVCNQEINAVVRPGEKCPREKCQAIRQCGQGGV